MYQETAYTVLFLVARAGKDSRGASGALVLAGWGMSVKWTGCFIKAVVISSSFGFMSSAPGWQ